MNSRKILKYISLVVMIVTLAAFVYTFINYKELKDGISDGVKHYSYAGIGIFSFILDGVPQFIGADVPLVIGGLLGLNIFWVFFIVSVFSALSGVLLYFIGLFFGKKIALLFIEEIEYEEYVHLAKRKGKFALTLTALTPIPYIPMLAGVFKMHFYDFLLYGPFMRTLRFAGVAFVLYFILA